MLLKQSPTYIFPRPLSKSSRLWNSLRTHLRGHISVTLVIFPIEMHFWPYVLKDWNLTKSFQHHFFEVWSWITLASLLRLCVDNVWVCMCVWHGACLFFFSDTMAFIARAREMRPMLLVSIRLLLSVFLPGCSSLSLSSPLNYYVCAHSSVTLNPGLNLRSDRRHRGHACCSDRPWHLVYGRIITVIKSKSNGVFTEVLLKPPDHLLL